MLTAKELACMSSYVEATMTDECVLWERGRVSDGLGGGTVSYTPYGTVPCYIAPVNVQGSEDPVGDRPTAKQAWEFALPLGTHVEHTARITVTGTPTRTFEVTEVFNPRTFATQTTVRAVEVL